jgi:integrase
MKTEFQISYFLWQARKDKNGLCPVYIKSKQNSDKQIVYNTGVKLLKDQWNFGTKKKPKNEPKNKPGKLLTLENELTATYRDLYAQGKDPITLNDLLDNKGKRRKPTDKNIIAWCDDYLKSDKYSEGQKKAVSTLKSNIKDFRAFLTFDKIKTPLLEGFFEHLTEKGVANNSQYKRLRAMVNIAAHAGQSIPDLTNYKISYSTKNALKQRLNWQEVKKVMKTKTESNIEATAKDVFLLACFSGLRISDIQTLNQGELHDYHYERIQTKTGQPVMVTLHEYNTELFQKFIQAGISYSRQKLSAALKDVLERSALPKEEGGQESGLAKEIVKLQQVGNKPKKTVMPKFKEISFHSGRRFYARLLNDLALGGEIARDELGHSFKSVTELYAGSQDHRSRVIRVRAAMDGMEKTLEEQEKSLMKVA